MRASADAGNLVVHAHDDHVCVRLCFHFAGETAHLDAKVSAFASEAERKPDACGKRPKAGQVVSGLAGPKHGGFRCGSECQRARLAFRCRMPYEINGL